MKTQQKNVLWIVVAAILAYGIGAYIGFPFVQMGMGSGDVGGIRRANKQQELLNSPTDVKLTEKYQTDTNYRNMLSAGYGILYVQTKATVATVESLKNQTGTIKELAPYSSIMDDVTEVGDQLSSMLEDGLQGLKAVEENKPAENLTFKLSQSLNLFQLMNNRLSDLEEFSQKTQQLAAQKRINDDVLKTYSEFLIESSDFASSCGDNSRAAKTLGMAKQMTNKLPLGLFESVANSYIAMTTANSPMVKMCGQKTAGIIKELFVGLKANLPMAGQVANNHSPQVNMTIVEPIIFSRDPSNMVLSLSQKETAGKIAQFQQVLGIAPLLNNQLMSLRLGAAAKMGSQVGKNAGGIYGRQPRGNMPLPK